MWKGISIMLRLSAVALNVAVVVLGVAVMALPSMRSPVPVNILGWLVCGTAVLGLIRARRQGGAHLNAPLRQLRAAAQSHPGRLMPPLEMVSFAVGVAGVAVGHFV
jgi:hypothetical protein